MKGVGVFGKELFKWFKPESLDTLIHFVTNKCNARCDHCFYSDSLNRQTELTLSQITRFTKSLKSLRGLFIGGGEPFLRHDLTEIITAYVSNCNVGVVHIPTNGFFTERIIASIERLISDFPKLNLTLAVSLDGPAEIHDQIRHLQGVFEYAQKTILAVSALKSKKRNLRVIVVSVLMPKTIKTIRPFALYVREKINPDLHWFEPVRFNSMSDKLFVSESSIAFLRENLKHYWSKTKGNSSSFYASNIFHKMIMEFSINNFEISYNNFLYNRNWPFLCTAGKKIVVLYPNGELASCELRDKIVNITDFDLDLPSVLKSKLFYDEQESICRQKCYCSHGCFIPISARYSFSHILKIFYKAYLK